MIAAFVGYTAVLASLTFILGFQIGEYRGQFPRRKE